MAARRTIKELVAGIDRSQLGRGGRIGVPARDASGQSASPVARIGASARDASALALDGIKPPPDVRPSERTEPAGSPPGGATPADGEDNSGVVRRSEGPRRLAGSPAVEGGGADEVSEDDEKAARRRNEEHEMRLRELEIRHQHEKEMIALREREAIRRENREEARRYGPLIAGTTTMRTVNGRLVTETTGWRNPNPRAGTGVFFDPDGGFDRSSGVGGGGIIDNSNGMQVDHWEVQPTNPPRYIPVYTDGKKGSPVAAPDFGSVQNPRGTGRLGIPAFSTETRDSFIQQNLGGAREGDAGYDRALARAQSMWDAYSRDAIQAFRGVGESLASEANKAGIEQRVSEASRDPFVLGSVRSARAFGGPLGSLTGGIDRSQFGQNGRIGIGPRDSQGRSALSPSWNGGDARGGLDDTRSRRPW